MDATLLQEYATILSSLDNFDVGELPSLMERHQYETFGEEGWDLPYRYDTVEEMLEQTQGTDRFIRDLVSEEPPSRYPILPGYEELRGLQIDHAIANGYYRDPVYAVCTRCGGRYRHFKYYRFLVNNDRLRIDERRAARIMNYPTSMRDCCRDPDTPMKYVDEDGNPATEERIVMARRPRLTWEEFEKIALYYTMSKNRPIDDLLAKLSPNIRGNLDTIMSEYQVPVLEEASRLELENWLSWRQQTTLSRNNHRTDRRGPPRLRWSRYNDVNNLMHDRMCVYLKECTACGHPTVYAYAYYLLARLNVDKESLFRDFEVLMSCCRATFMSPTFKPLPYDMDEREDFYEGIGIKVRRNHVDTKTYNLSSNQTVLVKRMDRDDVTRRATTEAPDRGIIVPGENL